LFSDKPLLVSLLLVYWALIQIPDVNLSIEEIVMSTTATTSSIYGIGSGLSNAASSSSSVASSVAGSLNANDYMTLFLAQLQNQDPTNPMQSYELAAQLAQFTTVEELSQANTYLGQIQQSSSDVNNAQIASLVGQDVTAQTSEIDVSSGNVSTLNYTLPAAATVTVTITDSSGSTVDTMNVGSQSAGTYSVPWTGTNSSGSTVSDGAYTCTVTATTSDGTSSAIQTGVTGTVYSCNLGNTPPTYTLTDANGMQIQVSNVYGVTTQGSTN
jgi:flagellar basal-body rod modification protein FlgD